MENRIKEDDLNRRDLGLTALRNAGDPARRRIELEIPGEPVAKGRPRFSRVGKFVRTHTPAKTVNYETRIQEAFAAKYPGWEPLTCPVSLHFAVYLTIPKSASKKRQVLMANGVILPTKKPDLDNVLKIIGDALNGLAYKDDSQIVNLILPWKRYDPRPRLEISICEIREGIDT
jgi:Holliday junction resolvase RusA-like endonuclease